MYAEILSRRGNCLQCQIYSGRTQSESRRTQQLPSPEPIASPSMVGAVFSPPPQPKQVIPDVVPMRRGRPAANAPERVAKPSPSPMRVTGSDPFAALDANSNPAAVDDISNRFPSLDQFSLLHDGGKFDFDSTSPTKTSQPRDLGQRVTAKLADDAFAMPAQSKTPVPATLKSPITVVSRAQKIISSNPELQAAASAPSVVYQPTPTRPSTNSYVSQGTMTSPPPSGITQPVPYNPSPVYRFPADHNRSSSVPRNQDPAATRTAFLRPENPPLSHPLSRNTSFESQPLHAKHTSVSSRPSLEGSRPSSDALDPVARTKSSNSRLRPSSTYLESNLDFLREKEKEASGRPSLSDKRPSYLKNEDAVTDQSSEEDTNIESNVDFLRTMDKTDTSKKNRRKSSSGSGNKSKRSSLPSMSLSGTKNLLAGRFGDAFKRFEHNTSAPPGPRTPSPLQDMARRDLTPIAGSEATDGRSDDGNILEDADNLAPEQRRELERRRLSMEEKRVANAAAEYRKRVADRGPTAPKSIGGISRAASIQNKVQSLLEENQGPSPKKTAEGYGRFTETLPSPQPSQFEPASNPYAKQPGNLTRSKPPSTSAVHARTFPTAQPDLSYASSRPRPRTPVTAPATVSKTGGPRPSAPPKPMHLNSMQTGPQNSPERNTGLPQRRVEARPDMTAAEREEYLVDFSKRFPSLAGIEMVERDIERDDRGLRTRDI